MSGPTPLVSFGRDRLPVILRENAWGLWLDPSVTDPSLLQSLLTPAADDALEIFPVSPHVNNVRHNGSPLIATVHNGREPDFLVLAGCWGLMSVGASCPLVVKRHELYLLCKAIGSWDVAVAIHEHTADNEHRVVRRGY